MSQVPAELKSLVSYWYRLVPGDIVYEVHKTNLYERKVDYIEKHDSYIKIKLKDRNYITVRKDRINFARDQYGNGKKEKTDSFFVDKFRAERELNSRIDDRIEELYEYLENCRTKIKELKNKYVT